MAPTAIGTTVDEVLALVDELDELTYGVVDLRTHALRCAAAALDTGADDDLVTAALLHDIGRTAYLARAAPGVPHPEVSRRFVVERFRTRAAWLVASHVDAKRYLAAVDADYVHGLPRSSAASLRRQGGAMSPREVADFEAGEWAGDAVALRRWDDAAATGDGLRAATPDDVATVLERAWSPRR
jgi:gamma-butyrobetaine dioxygenase